MGLNFGNPSVQPTVEPQVKTEPEMEIVPFNIQADKQQLTEKMVNSEEIGRAHV